ncbi:MAG: hypothetical protein RIS25_994 [Actinomycetota bacterium]|jgi:1-acyl-sn-glycerol-3-phosphate acyltransferase
MSTSERTLRWHAIAGTVVPLMNLISRIQVTGGENIPKTGSFILAPCHYSAIDPVIMGLAAWKSGRVPRFMAKASLFRVPVLGSILRWLGQVPVEREGKERAVAPMKAAQTLAAAGQGIIIYPEGSLTRDPDMWPMRGKTGAVRMALDANMPLIPAAHWGTQVLMPRYSGKIRLFPRSPIQVLIGKPLDMSRFEGKVRDQKLLAEATDYLMQAIADLQSQLRGTPAPVKRWNPADHGQSETGAFR